MQQQYLDKGPGAGRVPVCRARGGPPGFMDRGEPACGPGLLEDCRAGQGARLAQQPFQVVIQLQAAATAAGQALVPGDFGAAVEDHQFRGVQ